MKTVALLSLFLSLLAAGVRAQHSGGGIRWMSFSEAVDSAQKQPRKVFIDVYTKWCGWCKRMDATTFRDSSVIAYVNAHYYPVRLDAETRDSILFRDHLFTYHPEYKANELAYALLGGNMGYPNLVYLDEKFDLLTSVSGYQTVEELTPILRYFYEDRYKTQSLDDFKKEGPAK